MATPVDELAALDPRIARLIGEVDAELIAKRRSDRSKDRFEALARIIVGQQVSTAAARTVWGRVRDEFGGTVAPIDLIAPDAEPRLRACGLSGRKASYMIGIAAAIESGELRPDELDELTDEEVVEELVALKGIGQWSAEMFLIFDLGRPDVFSGGDLGLRRGVQIAYELEEMPTPEEAIAIAERLEPAPLARVALPLGGGPRRPPLTWAGSGGGLDDRQRRARVDLVALGDAELGRRCRRRGRGARAPSSSPRGRSGRRRSRPSRPRPRRA